LPPVPFDDGCPRISSNCETDIPSLTKFQLVYDFHPSTNKVDDRRIVLKTKNIVISRNKTILLFRILVSPYSNLQNITQTKKPANAGLLLKYYPFG
jgi:hypothetical protein